MAQSLAGLASARVRRILRFFPESSQAEREELRATARKLLDTHGEKVLTGLRPAERVMWYLASEGRAEDLVEVVRGQRRDPGGFLVTGARRPRLVLPGLRGLALPERITALERRDLPVTAQLTSVEWRGGDLVWGGYAFVANLPRPSGRIGRFAVLKHGKTGRLIKLRLRRTRNEQATVASGQALHCYDQTGFEVVVSARRLRELAGRGGGQWFLHIGIPGPGGIHTSRVRQRDAGTAGHNQVRHLADGSRLVVGFTKDAVSITVQQPPAEVESCTVVDGELLLVARARSGAEVPAAVNITQGDTGLDSPLTPLSGPSGSADAFRRYRAVFSLDRLTANDPSGIRTRPFTVTLKEAGGQDREALLAEGFTTGRHGLAPGRELAVHRDERGRLMLATRPVRPIVDTMTVTAAGELVIEGTYPGEEAAGKKVILRHGVRLEEKEVPVELADGRFTVRVEPEAAPQVDGPALPLCPGRWYLFFRDADAWDKSGDIPVTLRPEQVGELPLRFRGPQRAGGQQGAGGQPRAFTVDRREFDRIFIEPERLLGPDEHGAYRQRILREEYFQEQRKLPLRDAVLYLSLGGKQFSDSPRFVYEELVRRGVEVEHIWTQDAGLPEMPAQARVAAWGSRAWYEALARSRYVVVNTVIGDWFVTRPGQRAVQTWHGTPLKKIGADLLGSPKSSPAYIASLPHSYRQFDFVVSPNAYTTEIMSRAYCIEGGMFESGYPRNDVFYAPDRAERAARVRERLGLPEGKKVVLYAPTWREDQRHASKLYKLDLQIDLAAAQAELGHDHVLLFRKHPKVHGSVPGAGRGFVWDVTRYPDIADLYLVADVLITDYSSALFDFAHSDKPMLFFTYDLEHYRDTLRGLYFDFTTRAPGPLLKTSEQLVKALRDIDAVETEYKEKYARFKKDFCEPGDGLATARVVDRMLAGGPHATAPADG
ncbi:CDP-glycerol glycerophosphotransferase family protein [Streptomyces cyaneofuscatus]|uniref:CDP-glycerol glycerophosphotransferase family protein n=1 Tax=Streptomyces cyaneofuscatus TaxID=66883 RepID=UPI0038657D54|nr:CDP-glycerol glycerophosphotransferase family protein [Streptomyces cyaneofuscatus]WTA94200.1 CDP-glycerol glycerophosphotransferase family protein [Streptomyces cyaneofuscatus]